MSYSVRMKGRRLLVILLSAVIAFTMMPGLGLLDAQEAHAAEHDPVVVNTANGLVNIDQIGDTDTCEIVDFNYDPGASPTEIEIPAKINDFMVKKIKDGAFQGAGLTYVKFADDSAVEEIGENAFTGNNISEIDSNGSEDATTLPKTVKKIGKHAFENNKLLSLDLEDLAELKEIPERAFSGNTTVKGELKLPKNLETIGNYAFDAISPSKIVFPETISSIAVRAFDNVSTSKSTTEFDLAAKEPNSVRYAPWGARYSRVVWKDTNGKDANYNSAFLFDEDQGMIYGLKSDLKIKNYPDWNNTEEAGELTIPASIDGKPVTAIADGLLTNNMVKNSIKKVTFANELRIETIPAFFAHWCGGLTTVENVPATVKTVERFGFHHSNLTEITLPAVTKLEECAFYFATQMKSITFNSDAVASFGNEAFRACYKLSAINLKNMTKGKKPTNLMGGAQFATVYWANNAITEATRVLEEDTKGEWMVDVKNKTLIYYIGNDTDLVVPSSVDVEGYDKPVKITSVGEGASNIKYLNETVKSFDTVTISPGIVSIRQHALDGIPIGKLDLGADEEGCVLQTISLCAFNKTGCGNVTIPDTVTNIGSSAFAGCKMSGKITIPGNMTSLSNKAFDNNPDIDSFHVDLYRMTESDVDEDGNPIYDKNRGKYKKAEDGVISTVPWGASQASNQIFYRDEPQLAAKHEITTDTENNKVHIAYKGFTNNNFYIVKQIVAFGGMPELKKVHYPGEQGLRKPATATMEVEAETIGAVKGGNGTYKVNMTFGPQLAQSSIPNQTTPYDVEVNHFKKLKYDLNPPAGRAVTGTAPEEGNYVAGFEPPLAEQGNLAVNGYSFDGWNTLPDGKGDNYTSGDTDFVMPDADTTLYAMWKAGNSDVIFNAKDGKFEDGESIKRLSGTVDTDIATIDGYEMPTKEGYVFLGWSKTSTGSTAMDEIKVAPETMEVFAVYEASDDISVTFNANGGTIGTHPTKICIGTADTDLTKMSGYDVPTKEGHTFKGWAMSAGAENPDITTVPTKSGIVYAVWKINQYDITFDGNGGKVDGEDSKKVSGDYGTAFANMLTSAPVREGYNFMGWATTKHEETADIASVPAENKTVHALWKKKTDITVTFNANGGRFSEADSDTIVVANQTFNEPLKDLFDYEKPDRTYYEFKGWATTDDAEDANIFNVPAESGTVYAVWAAIPANDDEKESATAALNAAKDNLNATAVSTDGKDVADADKWVTQEEHDAFATAISKVEEVLDTENATQEKLASAMDDLNEAQEKFNSDKKQGTKDTDAARSDLKKAIEEAEKKIEGTESDKYTPESVAALQTAITHAKQVAEDPASTKDQLVAEKQDLEKAVSNLKTKEEPNDDPSTIPTEVTPDTPAPTAAVEKAITGDKKDGDIKGSTYAPLKTLSKKVTKKSVKLQWSKVKGATKYTVYGNLCGKGKKHQKIMTLKKTSINLNKIAGKKVKKGKYYKFIVIAEKGDKTLAISKTVHVCTKGHKKYDNYKSVNVTKKVIAKAKKLKKGKTLALKAKGVVPKGKKVQNHVKIRYESSNKKIATVSKTGKVKAVKKGSCFVYCYAQNGIAKKVKVTVK